VDDLEQPRERRVGLDELTREVRRWGRMTEKIYDAVFVDDPKTRTPSLFTRVQTLEDDAESTGINRAMVAIGTFVGACVGAIVSVYGFFSGGGHK
jgi:hypothetical protein